MSSDPHDLRPFVRAGYDALAPEYTRKFERELDGKPLDRELLAHFADVAGVGARVADIGCGPGQIGRHLESLGLRVTGFDLSRGLMREGRRTARTGSPSATAPSPVAPSAAAMNFVQADMTALPLRDASLGGLVAFYSIIHLRRAEVPRALAEFRRVLRPAAPLLLSVHAGEGQLATASMLDRGVRMFATLFSVDELEDLLSNAGFRSPELIERGSYPHESETRRIYAFTRRAVD